MRIIEQRLLTGERALFKSRDLKIIIGCPKERLEDGLARFKKGIENYINTIEVKGEI